MVNSVLSEPSGIEGLTNLLLYHNTRHRVGLREADEVGAWVEPVNSTTPVRPVVMTSNESRNLEGLRSGRRSALFELDGQPADEGFKVKGGGIESAFKSSGLYRTSHRNLGYAPEGGCVLSAVEREINNTLFFNELFTAEGFPVPYQPEATIHYGKMFEPDGRSECAEELAASVMRIKGDTRLAELYRLKVRDYEAARGVAFKVGLIAGAQKRVTNNFYWKDSQSTGNYVVFLNDGHLNLAPIDFEDTFPYKEFNISEEMRHNSAIYHTLHSPWLFRRWREIDLSDAPELEKYTITRIFGSMYRSSLSTVEGGFSNKRGFAPSYFKLEFIKGFRDGYKNPDRREPITRADLRAAYGLKV